MARALESFDADAGCRGEAGEIKVELCGLRLLGRGSRRWHLDDICRVDVFVRNMEDFDAIHAVRRQYFTGVAPASTMVEVSKLVNKDNLIEINAIALVQAGASA